MHRSLDDVAASLSSTILNTFTLNYDRKYAADGVSTESFTRPNASYIVSVDMAKSPFGVSGPIGSFSKTTPDTGGVPF